MIEARLQPAQRSSLILARLLNPYDYRSAMHFVANFPTKPYVFRRTAVHLDYGISTLLGIMAADDPDVPHLSVPRTAIGDELFQEHIAQADQINS